MGYKYDEKISRADADKITGGVMHRKRCGVLVTEAVQKVLEAVVAREIAEYARVERRVYKALRRRAEANAKHGL